MGGDIDGGGKNTVHTSILDYSIHTKTSCGRICARRRFTPPSHVFNTGNIRNQHRLYHLSSSGPELRDPGELGPESGDGVGHAGRDAPAALRLITSLHITRDSRSGRNVVIGLLCFYHVCICLCLFLCVYVYEHGVCCVYVFYMITDPNRGSPGTNTTKYPPHGEQI